MAQSQIQGNYHLIAPTAQLVSYARQFTDIPFAKEIAQITGAADLLKSYSADQEQSDFQQGIFSIMLEARYKSAWNTLKKNNITQVLEFASGLSYRGGMISQDNPDIIYVETDLPEMTKEKLRIMEQIPALKNRYAHKNLFVHSANALSFDELEAPLTHFSIKKSVGIMHEGFMPYLTMAEKHLLAKNCRKILETYGGVWITPDLDTKQSFENNKHLWGKNYNANMALLKERTGRDFLENCFENDKDIHEFFANYGLRAECAPQIDGSYELSCRNFLEIPEKTIADLSKVLFMWTISLQTS